MGAFALAAGAMAGAVLEAFAAAGATQLGAAALIGAVAAAAPAAVPVDDPIAAALRRAAASRRGRDRVRLLRALALRRRAPLPLRPRVVRDALAAAWADLGDRAGTLPSRRLRVRVRALERAHRAASALERAREALEAPPDALRDARDRLDAELEALAEAQVVATAT